MPFGLTNAPAAFQRLTNKVLGDLYDKFVISYLDDIVIFSDTLEEHKKHVDQVLQRLSNHKLYIKPSKCKWAVPELEFCGHIVGRRGIRIAPSKIQAVQEWQIPSSSKEVASFLGLTNYLSKYVDHYADIALPLTRLQSGHALWKWGEAEQTAFDQLKQVISTAPTLAAFDPEKPVYVYTDASGFAISGWLAQPSDSDNDLPSPLPTSVTSMKNLPPLRPITYYARKLIPAETRYPIHEQELLAIVCVLKANRHYLLGRRFRCFSDHRSLQHLQKQPYLSQRQARWVETLQDFDFEIEYLPGRWNVVADVLSRNPAYAPR
jgi:hypothetical protein